MVDKKLDWTPYNAAVQAGARPGAEQSFKGYVTLKEANEFISSQHDARPRGGYNTYLHPNGPKSKEVSYKFYRPCVCETDDDNDWDTGDVGGGAAIYWESTQNLKLWNGTRVRDGKVYVRDLIGDFEKFA